ncbi:m-AAA protease-interacting protein 1, mitochondrial [Anoplopoma fimbria]|uniref:m-AAA protease-interacting protein 1, mitochondrial n=1 Tax=Anoplopoma fimbria TaxID=229290 RepID=UPI0023EB6EA6|nr:m-AAA protease-interacting protein 1, mitochondrial [Anoplopoma fimbria]
MQRLQRLRSLAACSPGICTWMRGPTCSMHSFYARRFYAQRFYAQSFRLFGSQQPERPSLSVVGIPDPITWMRCKVIKFLVDLHFEVDLDSVEFEGGVKQALVHVSTLMSSGKYHRLVGIVSTETIDYIQTRCRSLSEAQRQQLAVTMDDIIFMLPEDVSVVFDEQGKKFCFVVMRFWFLSSYEGPDDPEGTKIFKAAPSEDGGPQKRIVTAVYEFHRELTSGASPDWTVTTVWHWHWKLAE